MPDTLEEAKEFAIDALKVGAVAGAAATVVCIGYKIYKHCTGREAATPSQPQPIDLTFVDTVLKDLIPKLALDPTFPGVVGKADRHRIYFIHRRARELGIANPALRQGPGLENLKQQVKLELDQLDQFLVEKLGNPDPNKRGPYFGGPELIDLDMRHLDLGNYISVRVLDPLPTTEENAVKAQKPDQSEAQTLRELESRRLRVYGIVLRGAALNPEVWRGTGNDSKLQKAELTEILDRRLRSVESLHYQASAGATPDGIGPAFIRRGVKLSVSNSSSEGEGWFDDLKHRIFETPSMPRSTSFDPALPFEIDTTDASGKTVKVKVSRRTLEEAFTELGIVLNDPGSPRFGLNSNIQPAWYRNHLTDEFDWNGWPGTRLKAPLVDLAPSDWARTPDTSAGPGYGWIMQVRPQRPAAEIIKELFTVSSFDLWDRSWLHSDGVMSALHLEALQFALRRRKGIEIEEKKPQAQREKDHEERLKELAEDLRLMRELNRPELDRAVLDNIRKQIDERIRKRREITAPQEVELNKVFNELATRFKLALDDYFGVRPGVMKAPDGIMKPGRTDYFENLAVPFDDLQIGDQVLFETNPVLQALGTTAWDYTTVMVTELEYFPNRSNLDPAKLTVQGFGTAELEQPSLQLLLAKSVDVTLKRVREFIKTQFEKRKAQAQSAGTPFVPPEKFFWDPGINNQTDFLTNDRAILRLWNPYGDTWDDPGPWWIWINMRAPIWRGTLGGDVLKTLGRTPGGIVWLENKLLPEFRGGAEFASTLPIGPGIEPAPWEDLPDEDPSAQFLTTIFVPLFQPESGWIEYFNSKARDPKIKHGPKLMPVVSDTLWLPGLAVISNNVRTIRPLPKPVV